MRQALSPHPETPAAVRVEAEAERPRPGALALRYAVTGDVAGLLLPAVAASARADELWRHTCFEAFVRAPSDAGYYEFNFAPSTQWAAYRFDGYREGMRVAGNVGAPRIEVRRSDERFELHAWLDLEQASGLPAGASWLLGLSAVIEDRSGAKSYWALAHPPGKPDFHHSDCFALELAAPEHA